MGARTGSSRSVPSATVSVDVVLITAHDRRLRVLTAPHGKRDPALPWDFLGKTERLEPAAARIARLAIGEAPQWLGQAGTFGDGTAHPGSAALSICYLGVVPWSPSNSHRAWKDANAIAGLTDRHRRMVTAAIAMVRTRVEQTPVAFSLLPREFTLSELQVAYETVLARRLHKASFRRALQAAFLVEPAGEWRSEGRGRPAQLFRYAPRHRRGSPRGVRLDLLKTEPEHRFARTDERR